MLGRKVRVELYRKDQYGRIVGMCYVRNFPWIRASNVSALMLKAGCERTHPAVMNAARTRLTMLARGNSRDGVRASERGPRRSTGRIPATRSKGEEGKDGNVAASKGSTGEPGRLQEAHEEGDRVERILIRCKQRRAGTTHLDWAARASREHRGTEPSPFFCHRAVVSSTSRVPIPVKLQGR